MPFTHGVQLYVAMMICKTILLLQYSYKSIILAV
jgi:hypothetical protein